MLNVMLSASVPFFFFHFRRNPCLFVLRLPLFPCSTRFAQRRRATCPSMPTSGFRPCVGRRCRKRLTLDCTWPPTVAVWSVSGTSFRKAGMQRRKIATAKRQPCWPCSRDGRKCSDGFWTARRTQQKISEESFLGYVASGTHFLVLFAAKQLDRYFLDLRILGSVYLIKFHHLKPSRGCTRASLLVALRVGKHAVLPSFTSPDCADLHST